MRGMKNAMISVRVRVGAHREQITGGPKGVLLVSVTVPAHEGRANRAVCRLLAKHLDVAPSRVEILRGRRSRDKLVKVDGVGQATVNAALGLDMPPRE